MISSKASLIFIYATFVFFVESTRQSICPNNISDDDTVLLPNDDNCSSYIQCLPDGTERVMPCPNGLYFNPLTKVCDWPENVDCQDGPKCPKDIQPDEDILLPNKHNCSTYFQCTSDGTPVLLPCPEGLEFNANTEQCDYPEEANCKVENNQNTETESGNNKENTSELDEEDNNINDNDDVNDDEHEVVNDEEKYMYCSNIKCPNEEDILFLAPAQQCNQFCKCANGIAFQLDCPSGLVFNPNVNTCDWPENYECKQII